MAFALTFLKWPRRKKETPKEKRTEKYPHYAKLLAKIRENERRHDDQIVAIVMGKNWYFEYLFPEFQRMTGFPVVPKFIEGHWVCLIQDYRDSMLSPSFQRNPYVGLVFNAPRIPKIVDIGGESLPEDTMEGTCH